jgi:hypothetical protein
MLHWQVLLQESVLPRRRVQVLHGESIRMEDLLAHMEFSLPSVPVVIWMHAVKTPVLASAYCVYRSIGLRRC